MSVQLKRFSHDESLCHHFFWYNYLFDNGHFVGAHYSLYISQSFSVYRINSDGHFYLHDVCLFLSEMSVTTFCNILKVSLILTICWDISLSKLNAFTLGAVVIVDVVIGTSMWEIELDLVMCFQLSIHTVLPCLYPLLGTSCWIYETSLTLYVAVTQFTYGKLRHCYVKS